MLDMNTASKKIVGFASDSHKLNLAAELCSVNDAINGKTEESTTSSSSTKTKMADKGVIHNGEYFFNSGSLTGDKLLHHSCTWFRAMNQLAFAFSDVFVIWEGEIADCSLLYIVYHQ